MEVVQEGKEPMTRCDFCIMHMPVWRLIRHRNMSRWDRNTHMMLRRWDVTIVDKCLDDTFSLIREDKAELIKGMGRFK